MQIAKLQQLGLTQKEAQVYLAVLEIGHGTAQKIAEQSQLPKSTAYDVLKSLLAQGLIGVYVKKKRRYFVASSPDSLHDKLKKQEEVLQNCLPELHALYKGLAHKPKVRLYEGKVGIRPIVQETLVEAKEIVGFGSVDEVFSKLDQHFPSFSKERAKRRIPIRLFVCDTVLARKRAETGVGELREMKFFKPSFPFRSFIWVWGNKVAISLLGEEMQFLVIESRELVLMLRALFEDMWKKA